LPGRDSARLKDSPVYIFQISGDIVTHDIRITRIVCKKKTKSDVGQALAALLFQPRGGEMWILNRTNCYEMPVLV
jgi:hypothetical protein